MSRLPISFAAAVAALALTLLQATVIAAPASHEPRTLAVAHR